ncbi:hypothetical protein CCH79_00016894 [Gambusia affinis]|uniref:Pre-mRNA-splicing factor SPF27 n=1 Tax=Gambusia affinis TaxID=33528 RepID=A0A315WAW2_GAMAF|nr:hypothetical protein CCH79_00016894 [Gambusia affinis]
MAGTASVAGEVFVDALPYFDQGYDAPGVREATEIMRNEFERLAARQPMELLSMKRKQIQDLNWQRKNDQLGAGAKLRELESNWVSLVSKNYEIERAIVQLENEVGQLRQQQGDENKENIRQDF